MASPSELRKETLRELRAARKAMAAAGFLLALQRQPREVQREAAIKQLETQQTILALENAELAEIRDQLIANEVELANGIAALGRARQNISKVAKIIETVGSVLTTVGKILKVAGTGL